MRSADYLGFYAKHFHTVEVDSTFYGCPTARTVNNWGARTPVWPPMPPSPPGDIAYVNLLKQLSAKLEREHPGEGGNAVAACGSAITSTFVDMIVLAYPKLFIPLDKK